MKQLSYDPQARALFVEMWNKDISAQEIAKKLEVSADTVYKYAHKLGLNKRAQRRHIQSCGVPNLSGTYEDSNVTVIANDPKQNCEEFNISFLNEETFKNEMANLRGQYGLFTKAIKIFEESSENFAKIQCSDAKKRHSIYGGFKNYVKKYKKPWKVRSHFDTVYLQKLAQ